MSLLRELLNERARLSVQLERTEASIDAIDVLIKNMVPGVTDLEDDEEMRRLIQHEKASVELTEKTPVPVEKKSRVKNFDYNKGELYKYVAEIPFGKNKPDLTLNKAYPATEDANRLMITDDKGKERTYASRTVDHYFEKIS